MAMPFPVIIVAGAAVAIVVIWYLLNRKPPVPGPCGLVVRPIAKDYCGGACPAGTACVATATRPYAGIFTQDSACACMPVAPAVAPPVAPPAAGGAPISGSDGIAPIGEGTHTGH